MCVAHTSARGMPLCAEACARCSQFLCVPSPSTLHIQLPGMSGPSAAAGFQGFRAPAAEAAAAAAAHAPLPGVHPGAQADVDAYLAGLSGPGAAGPSVQFSEFEEIYGTTSAHAAAWGPPGQVAHPQTALAPFLQVSCGGGRWRVGEEREHRRLGCDVHRWSIAS